MSSEPEHRDAPGDAVQGILAALQDYFDALYDGDVPKMRRVFMPQAHLFSAVEPPLVDWSLDEYMDVIANRESPAAAGAPRQDRILGIDVLGPETAVARVQCAVPPRLFTDALTFVRHEGRWRIVNKVFHYVPAASAKSPAHTEPTREPARESAS